MPLLDDHLEQISSSAKSIGELEFPAPKIFTNALLGSHEITTLIRDTEPHERALFSLDPNVTKGPTSNNEYSHGSVYGSDRISHGRKSIYATGPPVKQSAVARVLGPDMLYEIRQTSGSAARGKSVVNVEVLLRGAEKLCEVYDVEGATDKIATIRRRHQALSGSVTEYQELVLQQQSKLSRFNTGAGYGIADDGVEGGSLDTGVAPARAFTETDIQTEEAEIRELEARKKALEERVYGMEKDLEGLLR
ncbi:uncharacterized protein HMPREF1541_09233 [Cyphellophora europaea CBS 101466]|uniref:DASH complex subunit SPC34 n=1 Tax=Cyphellophora europaea (strain CBS 101466) TaxID=1220924 RepID=W2S9Q8_CYPE1|nr:uncharacterized protein HMPREF1541_09233 [Cyphellophora europaea CBS 101466]ETN45402.1 hypothetical protein HMPREF1541_09233 [Cyphellophora europaea CBS 101466]